MSKRDKRDGGHLPAEWVIMSWNAMHGVMELALKLECGNRRGRARFCKYKDCVPCMARRAERNMVRRLKELS